MACDLEAIFIRLREQAYERCLEEAEQRYQDCVENEEELYEDCVNETAAEVGFLGCLPMRWFSKCEHDYECEGDWDLYEEAIEEWHECMAECAPWLIP